MLISPQGDASAGRWIERAAANPVRPLRALQVEGVRGKLVPRLRNGDVVAVGGPVVGIRRRRNADRDRSAGRGRRGRRSRGPRNGTHGTTGRDRQGAPASCRASGEWTTRRRRATHSVSPHGTAKATEGSGGSSSRAFKLSAARLSDSTPGSPTSHPVVGTLTKPPLLRGHQHAGEEALETRASSRRSS